MSISVASLFMVINMYRMNLAHALAQYVGDVLDAVGIERITIERQVRAKHLPLRLPPHAVEIIDVPGESAPESTRPVLRVLDGGKR